LGEGLLAYEENQAVVAELVTTHGAQLRRFLLARARSASDVPDIIQEVYLRMLRVPNIESVRSPEAYLFTVAQHVVQQHTLRQSAIPPSVELSQLLNTSAASDTDPEMELRAHECLENLQRALDQLAPLVCATFLMHRRDGLSFDQIAMRLGISRSLVKKYLMKALMHMRQRLEKAQ
jgi:RNA polymerase sigma factor (sigma-70 family)